MDLPNHRAFVVFTVHIEHDGKALAFLLDLLEVPRSHSGRNLAEEFQGLLKEFGIEGKVSQLLVIVLKTFTY